jgi:hypothetical protein
MTSVPERIPSVADSIDSVQGFILSVEEIINSVEVTILFVEETIDSVVRSSSPSWSVCALSRRS